MLGPEQLEAWRRDGFLIVEHLVDGHTLTTLRTAYDEILSGQVAVDGDRLLGDITRQVIAPSSEHPTFDRNPAVRLGSKIARQLFGTENAGRIFDMLIYKAPGHPHETPWHQDLAYAKMPFAEAGMTAERDSIQFWVPMDDVDVETGCMQFIPGDHARPLLEHHVASGDPADENRLLALVDPESQLDLSSAVVAEIPAGAATMHTQTTPHYTGPNWSTNRPRRSYIFNIATN